MAGTCEHHQYVVVDQRKTNDRLEKLEAQAAINATMITAICDKMEGLIKSIDALVATNEKKMEDLEKRLEDVEKDEVDKNRRLQYAEEGVKEVRAWVIGAASGVLLAAMGWLIWYLQNHDSITRVTKKALLIGGGMS